MGYKEGLLLSAPLSTMAKTPQRAVSDVPTVYILGTIDPNHTELNQKGVPVIAAIYRISAQQPIGLGRPEKNPVIPETPKMPWSSGMALRRLLLRAPPSEPTGAILQIDGYCRDAGISPGDLCCVDFTAVKVAEGLLIVTVNNEWIGFKRFRHTSDGRLQMIEAGIAKEITERMTASFRVIGRITALYRRVSV